MVEDLGDGEAVLEVRCSAGTYVRRLASDIGERLGCGAYLTALRRTAVGTMSVDDAVPPDDVAREGGIAPLRRCRTWPRRELDADGALEVAHGRWRRRRRRARPGRSRWCATGGWWRSRAPTTGRAARRPGAGGPPVRRFGSFGDLPLGGPRRVVAIGTFDGVHVGHQAIIGRAIEIARSGASTRWR